MNGNLSHERMQYACKGNNGCNRRKTQHSAESIMQKCGDRWASQVDGIFPALNFQLSYKCSRARARSFVQIPDNQKYTYCFWWQIPYSVAVRPSCCALVCCAVASVCASVMPQRVWESLRDMIAMFNRFIWRADVVDGSAGWLLSLTITLHFKK